MKFKIPLSKPDLTKDDLKEIIKCFHSSWISSRSPWVSRFERLFARKVSETKYAIAVNSGTSALFLALKSLGIGKNDEVILPAFTMIATINAVIWVGANPVLVDCQSHNDWNLNINEIEKKITKKTKAILPVHIYGFPSDMDRINKLARKHDLYVIEDAAEAMGSLYKSQLAGSLGDISCYSLYSNKIITTGNGGVVATNNRLFYKRIKKLSFFDINPKGHFLHHILGYNLVLSGLQAALGVSQIRRFEKLLSRRKKIYLWYLKYLKGKNDVFFIKPQVFQDPNYWFPPLLFKDPKKKMKIQTYLTKQGIETRDFFRPLHLQPVYKTLFAHQTFPNSEYFYHRGLLLPSYTSLTEDLILKICDNINRFKFERNKKNNIFCKR